MWRGLNLMALGSLLLLTCSHHGLLGHGKQASACLGWMLPVTQHQVHEQYASLMHGLPGRLKQPAPETLKENWAVGCRHHQTARHRGLVQMQRPASAGGWNGWLSWGAELPTHYPHSAAGLCRPSGRPGKLLTCRSVQRSSAIE